MELTDLAARLAPYTGVALALACAGLLLAIVFEQAQLVAKYRGARRGVVATGYNNAMKLLAANRLGAVIYLFFIALSIDLGVAPALLGTSLAATLLLGAVSALVLLAMLVRGEVGWAPLAEFAALRRCTSRQQLAIGGAFVAALFSFAGLTIPLIWSAAHPELRLTLANSGFLFNSVFTLVNVFIVESEIARLIDGRHPEIRAVVQALYAMRFLAGLVAAPLLLVLA